MLNTIQYISQGNTAAEQLRHIQQVLDAGYRWVQLRFKDQEERTHYQLAEDTKRLCDSYSATLIINDSADIAKTVDADGLHLGLGDGDVASARTLLGPDKIIGGTANTLQDVQQRIAEGCTYIGLGPFRFTPTKAKLSPVLGLEGYRYIMDNLKSENVLLPVYAIGGITAEDFTGLEATGVHGIAVSGLLTGTTATLQQPLSFNSKQRSV